VGQGEVPITMAEEVGPLGIPLDNVEMEQVVIGLSTFSGIFLVGEAIGIGMFCYWKYRLGPAGRMAQDDGLEDVTESEHITCAALGRGRTVPISRTTFGRQSRIRSTNAIAPIHRSPPSFFLPSDTDTIEYRIILGNISGHNL
jgi:hypothetical protein